MMKTGRLLGNVRGAIFALLLVGGGFMSWSVSRAQSDAIAPTPASAAASSAVSPSAACVPCAPDPISRRIDVLTQAVEAAASAAKAPPIDPWQDSKSVVLNVISSRLDHWLFGSSAGGPGFVALLGAVVAFAIALLRLAMALALFNPSARPGRWGDFKNWVRQNIVSRSLNVVIAAVMVLITAAALYVVLSARSDTDQVKSSLTALDRSLGSCQAELERERERSRRVAVAPAASAPPAPPALTAKPLQDALDKISQSCDAATLATRQSVGQVQKTADGIADKQPWWFTKLFAFLATVLLVVFAIRKW